MCFLGGECDVVASQPKLESRLCRAEKALVLDLCRLKHSLAPSHTPWFASPAISGGIGTPHTLR